MTLRMGWRGSVAVAALALDMAAVGQASAQASSADPAPAPAPSEAKAPAPRFMIRAFQVKGNHLLAPGEVEEAVYPFMGPDKTPDDVEHARAALQALFAKSGYATVSVSIPDQSVESGAIRLDVQAQSIGQVTVTGGKRTSTSWVIARAPSLAPGSIPDFKAVQNDVVALNATADRRVTPEVKAGTAPGTVDVDLKVEDSSPFHGSLEVNNYRSYLTTNLRLSATARYDDLWGRGDSLSVSAQTAPSRTQDGTVFSGNYMARLGRLQLLAYYVHSDSDISVVGGTTVVGKGGVAGVRLILPLSQSEGFYNSLTAGIDYKNFKEDVALGADRSRAPIQYWPVTIGWRGDWTGKAFKANASLTTTFGLRGFGDDAAHFDAKRYDAKPDFFDLKGDAAQTVDTVWKLQLYAHETGQWSPAPLISNEEFSVGGAETVRGYYESELLGDYGAALQTELRSPQLGGFNAVDELRLHLFWDGGYAGLKEPLSGQTTGVFISSTGAGLTAKLLNHINGAVDLGTPIISGPDTKSDTFFGRFRIWGEF